MINIKWLKRQAKKIVRENNICHMKALHLLAKKNGYKCWGELLEKNKQGNEELRNE